MQPIEFIKMFGFAAGLAAQVDKFGIVIKNGAPTLTFHKTEPIKLTTLPHLMGLATSHAYRLGVHYAQNNIDLNALPTAFHVVDESKSILGCDDKYLNQNERDALEGVNFDFWLPMVAPMAYLLATCWHHHHDVLNIICDHVEDGQEFLFDVDDIRNLVNDNIAPLIRLGNQQVWTEFGVQTQQPIAQHSVMVN